MNSLECKLRIIEKMYTIPKFAKTSIEKRDVYEGESIEKKVERILNNKETITDGAPIIYQDRKDGIEPAYDIRSDRFDIAIEAMDKVAKAKIAKREETMKEYNEKNKKEEKAVSKVEPTHDTSDQSKTTENQ